MNEQILIEERDRLLANAVEFFVRDSAVVGVFLGGSIPAGKADAYSDIDLRVVITPEEHARFVEDRLEMPKKWGDLLFNEWLEGAEHCVSHFKPFGKVDVFYLSLANFHPSPWYAFPQEILHDPIGVIVDIVERSRKHRFEISEDEIDRSLSKGLAAAHEVYRRIQKDELVYAQSLLNGVRGNVIQAEDWIEKRAPRTGVFPKFEKYASQPMIHVIRESYVGLDEDEIGRALKTILRAYRKQIIELHQQFSLNRSLEKDLYAVDLILDEVRENG